MATDTFWNNRETAQKLIEESNVIKRKLEPLTSCERKLSDFQTMLELGDAEPE